MQNFQDMRIWLIQPRELENVLWHQPINCLWKCTVTLTACPSVTCLNFISLREWTWRHNASLHARQRFSRTFLKLREYFPGNWQQRARFSPVYQGFWIILILQDKTLFNALEAGDIVCWLVNQPIAKLDLFKSFDCRWITYAEYCYSNLATVRRLVQSPTLQSTMFL